MTPARLRARWRDPPPLYRLRQRPGARWTGHLFQGRGGEGGWVLIAEDGMVKDI
jgi:hypothetical protein